MVLRQQSHIDLRPQPAGRAYVHLRSANMVSAKEKTFAITELSGASIDVSHGDDGDTYRVLLQTASGNLPMTSYYSSGLTAKQQAVDQINSFVMYDTMQTLSIKTDDRIWVAIFSGIFAGSGALLLISGAAKNHPGHPRRRPGNGLARQLPVLDPVRLVGRGAETGFPVRLVLGIVPVEPDHLALPLEGQDVGGDAVEEPAVMADDHGAAGEILQRLLQGAHGVHVQVVGRFVEEQDVGPLLQHPGQVDAVPLAAGEHRPPSSAGRAPEKLKRDT